MMDAPATPVNVSATGAARAAPADFRGYSLRETAGAPAVVRIFDHASAASGDVLDEIGLAANESKQAFYPGRGVRAKAGVFVQVVSGTVTGSVRIG